MSQYWDSGWTSFKYKTHELFLDVDFNLVKPEDEDITQTLLDKGVDGEDLASSERDEREGD